MTATTASARPKPAKRAVAGGLAVLAAGLAGWLLLRSARPAPPMPLPAGIAALDPQVRGHLARLAQDVQSAPRQPGPRAELGLAFAVNGLWPEARQSFLDAMRLGDRSPLPALHAAVALQELGDLPAATEELRALTRRHPAFMPAWQRLGTALLAGGDAAGAEEAFNAVTRLAPEEWRGWAGLGEARLRAGRAAEAVASLERAVALDPFARNARFLLGQALQATGRTAEAARELAAGRGAYATPAPDDWSLRALAHMKSLPDQFERADSFLAQGRTKEAVMLLQEAHRFHGTNAAVAARLARALAADGREEAAWRLVSGALAAAPEDVPLLIAASETAATLGLAEQALDLARRAVALAPRQAAAHVALGNAHLAAERDAEAEAALRRALELAPADPGLWLQLGDLLRFNLERPAEAAASYARALELDPIHPVALQRLATLHLERGEAAEARRRVAELRALQPDPGLLRALEQELARLESAP